MKNAIPLVMAALFLLPLAACEEPAAPTPEPAAAIAEQPAELPPVVAVPEADILKAVEVYKALHDDSLDLTQKQDRVTALLEANGWTEQAYRDMLYDISAHPASRETYVRALPQP
jgi:hypothetical protein